MAKKDNGVLYLAIGAAVLGYFLFKKGGVLNTAPGNTLLNAGQAAINAGAPGIPAASYTSGIALENATPDVINNIQPTIDPTGMQIQFI